MIRIPETSRDEEPSQQKRKLRDAGQSLDDLASLLDERQLQKQQEEARKQEEEERLRQERFEALLKGKFGQFHGGNFAANILGLKPIAAKVESINIFPSSPDKETGKVKSLNIVVFKPRKEGENIKKQTFSLTDEGRLFRDKKEEDLGIDKKELLDRVLDIAEMVDASFFMDVNENLFPPGERPETEPLAGKERESSRPVTDPRRIEFMRNQPQVLFGFVGVNKGFDGYRGFVFPSFFVLENAETQNAAYFFEFGGGERITVDEATFSKPPAQRMAIDERRRVFGDKVAPILGGGLTKQEALRIGATRKVHESTKDTEWGKTMEREIERRLGSQQE